MLRRGLVALQRVELPDRDPDAAAPEIGDAVTRRVVHEPRHVAPAAIDDRLEPVLVRPDKAAQVVAVRGAVRVAVVPGTRGACCRSRRRSGVGHRALSGVVVPEVVVRVPLPIRRGAFAEPP